jgi:hypothetical protein
MKRTIQQGAAILLLLACTAHARSAEPISGVLQANPTGEVTISVVRGNVTVIGVDGDEVRVEGTRDEESEAFVFERDGDAVRIQDKLPRHTSRAGGGTRITVQVPRGSRVRAQLVSADLDVRDVSGTARLNTVSGSVTARGLGGEVEIKTVSGGQSLAGAGGEIRMESVSGSIRGEVAASRLAAKTVSGAVELTNTQPLQRGTVGSVSGAVKLRTSVEPDVEIELETVSGQGTLALLGDLNLRLNVAGGPGGRIRNQLDDTPVSKGGLGIGQRLEATLGEGRGYVRASTISGTLTLTRE